MTFDIDTYFQGHSAMTLLKHLKYGTSFCVCSTGRTVLVGLFPYWAQMIKCIFQAILLWLCNKTAKIWYILPCPLYSMYISGCILSLYGTNDHQHERVCRGQQPFSLTFIFKVTQPWLYNKTAEMSALQHIKFWMNSFHIWHKYSLAWEGMSHTMTFDLDLYLQGYWAVTFIFYWLYSYVA